MTAENLGTAQADPNDGEQDRMRIAFAALDGGLAIFDLTVLPMDSTEDGLYLYDEAAIDLVKDLRAAGIDAGYAHESAVRRYYSERSADVAVNLLINLASAAVWEALLFALVRYRGRRKLAVTLIDESLPDGTERKIRKFDGSGEDVLEAMRIYQRTENDS